MNASRPAPRPWPKPTRHLPLATQLCHAQFQQPFAGNWGDGTTSSSDGQRFRAGSKAESTGHINPNYGVEPGRLFYTHISDQYAPFSVNVGVRDSTYVLNGLLYHESDLRIEEHYTDTAGFTDHVFGLMHLLGFRFAPRFRDLGDTKIYIPKGEAGYDALKPMIGGTLNIKHIRDHWDEILRLGVKSNHPIDGMRCRPISHDTPPPRTVAAIRCPSRCSITGFHGTRLKPIPSSSIA